ncbi:hypothetical protein EMCRGX_G025389 [Ephydatia muelleri]
MNQEEGCNAGLGVNLDALNDETFGSGAIEDDWEASHTQMLEAEVVASVPSDVHRAPQVPLVGEEALPLSFSNLTLKQLWPSSSDEIRSIWESPQTSAAALPPPKNPYDSVPASKMLFAEDLEKELTSEGTASSEPSVSVPSLDVLLPHPYPQHMQLPIFPSYLPLRGRAQFPPPPGSQTVVMGMSSHGHTHGHPQLHPRGMWPPLHQGGPLMAHPPPRQGMPHPFVPPHPPPPGFMMRFPPMAHGPPPHEFFHSHRMPHPHDVPGSWRPHPPPPSEHRSSRYSELLCDLKPDWSGFMTTKEKDWVLKIQLIQLQSPDPSNDDYYYQKFMQKKVSSERQATESKSVLYLLPHLTHESKEYKPVEFEGALGKLSVQSISAPRRVIEVGVAGDSERDAERQSGREAKRRQVLITIEKLYSVVLQIEEFERKAVQMAGEQRERLLERKGHLCTQLVLMLRTNDESGDQVFQMILSYRKGRRLLNRAVSVLPDLKAYDVLQLLLRNLALAVKRDAAEPVLGECLVSACAVIKGLLLPQLVDCLETLFEGVQLMGGSFPAIIHSKFVLCVLDALLDRGRTQSSNATTEPLQLHWRTLCSKLHALLSPYRDKLPTDGDASFKLGTLVNFIATTVQSTA